MSDGFLVIGAGVDGTTSATDSLGAGAVAGCAILAFGATGSSAAPATHTVSDNVNAGAYTELLTGAGTAGPAIDTINTVWANVYLKQNHAGGAVNVTFTGSGGTTFCLAVAISADTAAALMAAISNFQANPGAGANAITTGTVTPISAASTLIGFFNVSSSLTSGDRPTVGTGFTQRIAGTSGNVGVFMLETIAAGSAAAATGTSTGGAANRFCCLGVALKNGASVSSALFESDWNPMEPQTNPLTISSW